MRRLRSLTMALVVAAAGAAEARAQADTAAVGDTVAAQDGVYDRPFILSSGATALGGYVEGNTNYFVEDGISEGFSMELRRFNVFLYADISRRVRFLSELEFEHGTEEIALETAQVDVRISPWLAVRAGVILPPLGFFNQNHDSPRWDFIERPLVSTNVIPSTLSEVGGGVFGRFPTAAGTVTYDLYLTNGLGDGVLDNDLGRTDIASGKGGEAFAEDNNGSPAVTGRVALRRGSLGELGISYHGGHYNRFRLEGEDVDASRWLGIAALDVQGQAGPVSIRGEAARATIDVPPGMAEVFAAEQWGGHLDAVVTVWRPVFAGYENATLAVGLRAEHVDYNVGTFSTTGADIRDDVTTLVPTVAFRPTAGTVFRVNYRRHWMRDFAGNPTNRLGGWQLGFASYF